MKQQLLSFVLALALMLPTGLLASGREPAGSGQTAPGEPAAPSAAAEIYYVDWNISASGESDVQGEISRKVTRQQIQISGSAVVHHPPGGFLKSIPFQLTVTDDWYQVETDPCSEDHEWWSITDPGRWNGGPDPIWWNPSTFWPQQRSDGSWFMENPFSDLEFVVSGQLGRNFNYRADTKRISLCGGENATGGMDFEMAYYAGVLFPLRDKLLEGDSTGTVFSLSDSYVVLSWDVELNVQFNATVRVGCAAAAAAPEALQAAGLSPSQACSCKNLPRPIPANSPYITKLEIDVEGSEMTPDEERDVLVSVTCEGVPVKDAELEVTVRPRDLSGGHIHLGGRPRGIIEGVPITVDQSSVTVQTDSSGYDRVSFQPGQDLSWRSYGGFAGIYEFRVRPLAERFVGSDGSADVAVRFDLDPLSPDVGFTLLPGPWAHRHNSGYYATRTALDLLQGLQIYWQHRQLDHNVELAALDQTEWPFMPLVIVDVSLPWGGLYDQDGSWRTPFYEHQRGTDVLFKPEPRWPGGAPVIVPDAAPDEVQAWFYREFWELGNVYGSWFVDGGGSPYNLHLGGTALAQHEAASVAGPDLAVVAFPRSRNDRVVVGAGQTFSYTLGLENVASGTTANNAALSASLPPGLSFVGADPPPTRMDGPQTPVWEVGALPATAIPEVFTLLTQVNPNVAPGSLLSLTVQATTTSADAKPANNQFAAVPVLIQAPGPDLTVYSELSATALTIGEPVSFTISAANEGNAPASYAWTRLYVPEGVTISADPPGAPQLNGILWNLGTLEAGASRTLSVTARVDPALPDLAPADWYGNQPYPLDFLLTTDSSSLDIDRGNNSLIVDKRAVLPGPDLVVALHAEETPGPGLIAAGQEMTYTLHYANLGNRLAETVTATLQLWPGLGLLNTQPAPGGNQVDPAYGVRMLTWYPGELAVGDDGAVEVRLRVDEVPPEGSIVVAAVSSNGSDLNAADNVEMEVRHEQDGWPAPQHTLYLPLLTR